MFPNARKHALGNITGLSRLIKAEIESEIDRYTVEYEYNKVAHYFGLEANLDNHKEYYRQKHNPDEYIAKLIYDYRNKLDGLHWKIRESGRPLDLYNNGYYIEEYQYDPCGNVVMEGNAWGTIDFAYNTANQLLQTGERTYSYDANGNLVKEGYKGDYVEYSYNYENRLISASNLSQNDKLFGGEHPFTGTITYTYDAYGNPYAGRFLHMPKHNPYGFTGQRFEPELRMYSFAYRIYNPVSIVCGG